MRWFRFISVRALVITIVLFCGCSPDCKELTVQVADWQTCFEDYWEDLDTAVWKTEMVDTTVAYTIEKYYTVTKYTTNSSGKENSAICTHYVKIRNTNNKYSGRFAIRIDGKEYNESREKWQDMSKSTSYVTIYPNSTYTFQISHSAWWHNRSQGYNEADVELHVLQGSNYVEKTSLNIAHLKIKKTRRKDKLILKDSVVNNCDCDVDVIRARNEAVQDVFSKLQKQNVIQTY